MFNIGMPELIVILAVALIVLGPKRLPEVGRALGKAMAEFRKATSGISQELENARAMLEEEARKASEPTPNWVTQGLAPRRGQTPRTRRGPRRGRGRQHDHRPTPREENNKISGKPK